MRACSQRGANPGHAMPHRNFKIGHSFKIVSVVPEYSVRITVHTCYFMARVSMCVCVIVAHSMHSNHTHP